MSVTGPTIVRRQLGRRLRQARLDAGKSVDDVTSSKVVSRATLHRFESGRCAVTPGTVLELGLLYDLDRSATRELYELALGTTERGWWEDALDASGPALGLYIGLESAASTIESFMPVVMPGLLQTADYAREVERSHVSTPDERAVEQLVRVRMERQRMTFSRSPRPTIRTVLGPEVLHRQVGGPGVMSVQRDHLAKLAAAGQAEIRVLPSDRGAHAGMAGPFTLMSFHDPDDPPVAYAETAVGGSYFELPDQVACYRRILDLIHTHSVPLEEYRA